MSRPTPLAPGFSLIELIMASALLGIAVAGAGLLFRMISRHLAAARTEIAASRVAQTLHSRLSSMDFFRIFPCDTARSSDWVPGMTPNNAMLVRMQEAAARRGFPRFTLDVRFMRRDRSDAAGTGATSNLVPFTDANGDGVDDTDSNLRFRDLNGDGDFYDVFFIVSTVSPRTFASPNDGVPFPDSANTHMEGGTTYFTYAIRTITIIPTSEHRRTRRYPQTQITEMPDTRLKEVTLRLFRHDGRMAHQETFLLSSGMFSGNVQDEWESILRIVVEDPPRGAVAFEALTTDQNNARAISLKRPYPPDPPLLISPAGGMSPPWRLAGVTLPLANALFRLGAATASGPADDQGAFSIDPLPLLPLQEGLNEFEGQASKAGQTSPLWRQNLVMDRNPPVFLGYQPPPGGGPPQVPTRRPFIGIELKDQPIAGGAVVSGIQPAVIWIGRKDGAMEVPFAHQYNGVVQDPPSSLAVPCPPDWVCARRPLTADETLLPPLWNDGDMIHLLAEAGDRARYGVQSATPWRFKVQLPAGDGSPPELVVAPGCLAPGSTLVDFTLEDPESGVDAATLVVSRIRGAAETVLLKQDPPNQRVGAFFDSSALPATGGGRVRLPLSDPLASGDILRVRVENFLGDPLLAEPTVP